MDTPELLAELTALQRRFHAGLREAPPAAPVPSCAGWTITDLADHLADVHAWAALMASDQRSVRPPVRRGNIADHYAGCADELHRTLVQLDPETLVPTFDGRGPAAFWHRRQTHETLIHLYDLSLARGSAAPEAAAAVWADAVDEVVHVLHPRQVLLGRAKPLQESLRLVAEDAGSPGGTAWTLPAGAATPAATVTGTAQQLALVLWRRLSLDAADVVVSGDADAARRELDAPVTP